MANAFLFNSWFSRISKTSSLNKAGAASYEMDAKSALTQYCLTGCLNSTFYAHAQEQLSDVLRLSEGIEAEYLAKLALESRQRGLMKDMPALLCAILSIRDTRVLEQVFDQVLDNGRMIRTFVQIIRSGQLGRKSFGSAPKRMIQSWLENRTDTELISDAIGGSPSLADVIKMVHPRPSTEQRAVLYSYILGRLDLTSEKARHLPESILEYERFKKGTSSSGLPQVPWQMLSALNLTQGHWAQIAQRVSWQTLRMNLNTFARHGVFESEEMTEWIANRLKDPEGIKRAKAFPYQLMSSWMACEAQIPSRVKDALEEAMEISIAGIPMIQGKIYVCPDVSGSMSSPITGYRKGSSSTVRCIDVAALMSAMILRKNVRSQIIPFEEKAVGLPIDPLNRVMMNARKLASVGGGGTNCSAPLKMLNEKKSKGDLVLMISDNQSWIDAKRLGSATEMLNQWEKFKKNNPQAKLVCLDIQPYANTQVPDRSDILNIGGFSDAVFETIRRFAND